MTYLFKKKKKYKNLKEQQGGFIILYAILLSTVILTIGLAILDIMIQQISLSGTERDSSRAFYAADSALECILYWDNIEKRFEGSGMYSDILCSNQTPEMRTPPSFPKPGSWQFEFWIDNVTTGTCAYVLLQKTADIAGSISSIASSRGYNTTCPVDKDGNRILAPRRLERGLRATY